MITLAIDVMGGDVGPAVVIPAALMALKQHSYLRVLLVGDNALIKEHLATLLTQPEPRCVIQHAGQQVGMEESPLAALRYKTNSSMRVALDLVQEGTADACLSGGNTGALMAMAHFVLKTLPGIDRPAMSIALPTIQPNRTTRLLDIGANTNVQVEHLFQFAIMGLILARKIDQIASPKVALLNIGSEAEKGNILVKKAGEFFSTKKAVLNYVGYIEGDALFNGVVDVAVCDGFTGNIAIKLMEGTLKLASVHLQQSLGQSGVSRLLSGMAKPFLKQIEQQLNVNNYNGASFMGLHGTVVKSHGKANIQEFYYAIQKTITEVQQNIPQCITAQVNTLLN